MIRLISFAVVVLGLAWGFSWLADRPGEMMILWQGQRIETSLMVAAAVMLSLLALCLFVWWLFRLVMTSPQAASRYFRARKRDRGYQALSTGLIAAGAGNALLATKMAERTRGLLSADQEPLIHLLEAQAALIKGDHDAARRKFEAMSEDPETRELGLRGLYMEAKRAGADEAAEHYASQAVDRAPYLPWASQAVLEYRTRASDYDKALDLLDKQRASNSSGGRDTAQEKAVLLTARAMARLDADPKHARDDALQALKLSPALVPAAIVAAKAWFREDNTRRGSAVLEQVWKIDPHPHLAETYIRARSGDAAADRLKRAEKLEALKPDNPVAIVAVARAALEARLFEKARQKAEAALQRDPREGILMLLAEIEEAEMGDQARIRHYLAAALRAPRDPAWVADGIVSADWQPMSPVTGQLGAFQWKPPYEGGEEPSLLLGDMPPPAETAGESGTVIEAAPGIREDAQPVAIVRPAMEPVVKPDAEGTDPSVVPFFGHAPDDPGVRAGATQAAPEKKRKPLF